MTAVKSRLPVSEDEYVTGNLGDIVRRGAAVQRFTAALLVFLCLFLAVFVLATAAFGGLSSYLQRVVFICGIVPIGLIARSAGGRPWHARSALNLLPDLLLSLLVIAGLVYLLGEYDAFVLRMGFPATLDLAFGVLFLVLTLEVTRRTLGWPILAIVAFFLLQALFGQYLPGPLQAPNVNWRTLVEILFMQDQGLFGPVTEVAATYLMLFLIFGAILTQSNAVRFFQNFSMAVIGRRPGGPAHVAVLSSSLLGTASGSVVGNVVGTGSFTIPLMKRAGFRPEFSGGVEAAASSGGQLMPPIMGSAAFLMAGFLGIGYWTIAAAAIIPALLFYLGIFAQIELRARAYAMPSMTGKLPTLGATLREDGHLLLGILALIVPFFFGASPQRAGIIGVCAVFVLVMLRRHTRLSARQTLTALIDAFLENVAVGAAVAAAGILMGTIWISGAGSMLADLVIKGSFGMLPLALVLTAIVALILGMGLPTPAVYLTVALLIVPSLVKLGADVLASHMFAFYFGILANVTPPVAIAAYAAASLAGADLNRTGWAAFKLALSGFIIPFLFVYHTGLLLKGVWYEIIFVSLTAAIGVVALSMAVEGWYRRPLGPTRRAILGIAALGLVAPEVLPSIVGMVVMVAVLLPLHRSPVVQSQGAL
jgi:TRAP transporter 4TM/12TM fusion protein